MKRHIQLSTGNCQKGAILLLAMLFLLLLAIVSASVTQTSILELQMAGNWQFEEQAYQRAQAVASALARDPNNFPVAGDVGYTLCANGDTAVDCNAKQILNVPQGVLSVSPGVNLSYRVQRKGPLLQQALPVRLSEQLVSGSNAFSAAIFEVSVAVDGTPAGLGSSEIAVGIARRVAPVNQ